MLRSRILWQIWGAFGLILVMVMIVFESFLPDRPPQNASPILPANPSQTINQQTDLLRQRMLTGMGLIGVLMLPLGYLIARRVHRRMACMTELARDLTRGEGHHPTAAQTHHEAGQLFAAINELALSLRHSVEQVTGERDQLESVLAGLTEGVVALDLSQRILHVNQAARSMLGLRELEVLGKQFSEVPTLTEIKQAVATGIAERKSMTATISFGSKTLECSLLLTHQQSSADNDDIDRQRIGYTGAILVLEDVTLKLHLEEVRSDFVANASHELKTPISAVRGLVETIIDDPDMSEDVFSRFIERIRQQTIRLDNIVQDLLQLSRFDSSERRKSLSRINLTALLRQVYASKSGDAEDVGLELTLVLQASTLAVDGEVEALNQMVTNLVDNALKYTPEGGKIQLKLLQRGARAHIEVKDNGIGIAGDDKLRIFERFYRVDQARSREQGGTGLGLAIVKHIARAHHGSVSVESAPGKGSVFSVQLPLAADA